MVRTKKSVAAELGSRLNPVARNTTTNTGAPPPSNPPSSTSHANTNMVTRKAKPQTASSTSTLPNTPHCPAQAASKRSSTEASAAQSSKRANRAPDTPYPKRTASDAVRPTSVDDDDDDMEEDAVEDAEDADDDQVLGSVSPNAAAVVPTHAEPSEQDAVADEPSAPTVSMTISMPPKPAVTFVDAESGEEVHRRPKSTAVPVQGILRNKDARSKEPQLPRALGKAPEGQMFPSWLWRANSNSNAKHVVIDEELLDTSLTREVEDLKHTYRYGTRSFTKFLETLKDVADKLKNAATPQNLLLTKAKEEIEEIVQEEIVRAASNRGDHSLSGDDVLVLQKCANEIEVMKKQHKAQLSELHRGGRTTTIRCKCCARSKPKRVRWKRDACLNELYVIPRRGQKPCDLYPKCTGQWYPGNRYWRPHTVDEVEDEEEYVNEKGPYADTSPHVDADEWSDFRCEVNLLELRVSIPPTAIAAAPSSNVAEPSMAASPVLPMARPTIVDGQSRKRKRDDDEDITVENARGDDFHDDTVCADDARSNGDVRMAKRRKIADAPSHGSIRERVRPRVAGGSSSALTRPGTSINAHTNTLPWFLDPASAPFSPPGARSNHPVEPDVVSSRIAAQKKDMHVSSTTSRNMAQGHAPAPVAGPSRSTTLQTAGSAQHAEHRDPRHASIQAAFVRPAKANDALASVALEQPIGEQGSKRKRSFDEGDRDDDDILPASNKKQKVDVTPASSSSVHQTSLRSGWPAGDAAYLAALAALPPMYPAIPGSQLFMAPTRQNMDAKTLHPRPTIAPPPPSKHHREDNSADTLSKFLELLVTPDMYKAVATPVSGIRFEPRPSQDQMVGQPRKRF